MSLGQYDLVLTDFAEAGNLQKQIASSSTRTVVVPVMLKHTKAEETAAARQYKVIVKNPTSADDFVAAIYQVMKSKANKS
jgi:ABC-type sugar transport system substrate-binding protein